MFGVFRIIFFTCTIPEFYCSLIFPDILIEKALNVSLEVEPVVPKAQEPVNHGPVPRNFDWREQGMVSPVKNQMSCDACWAFTVVANIESHLKIYLNEEMVLSEQFLLDCDADNAGCDSGSLLKTFANIVANFGGVLRDQDYFPYASRRLPCRWKKSEAKVSELSEIALSKLETSVKESPPNTALNKLLTSEDPSPFKLVRASVPVPVIGFRRVASDEQVMAEFLYKFGPLAAAINSASMAKYKGDIDEPTAEDCDPEHLNHSVLIVGYNVYVSEETGDRVPYWIIKNSWGMEWGDRGYYYLVRGRNACGIAKDVSLAFVN